MNPTDPAVLRYTKIVAHSDGESQFVDAELPLSEGVIATGTLSAYRELGVSPVSVGRIDGSSCSYPHNAPRRQWIVVLRGMCEVQVTDGATRRFGPGDVVLAEDVDGSGHITRPVGESPVDALFLPAGGDHDG